MKQTDERRKNCRILTEDEFVNNDTWTTQLNNNDIIIGPSGSGKTRGYVIPNILQMNGSMIVADTKGGIRRRVEKTLKENGYTVQEIDFTSGPSMTGYNPFDFSAYDEENECYRGRDLKTVATLLVPVEDGHAPFWDYAARQLFECLASYVLEFLPKKEQNLTSVLSLFSITGSNTYHSLFQELEELASESYSLLLYNMIKDTQRADKMYESIKGVLSEKIYMYAESETKKLFTAKDRVEFESLGKRKTALFLTISDTDRSMDRLINLFYSQAFHKLCESADKYEDGRLPIPVRFFLDDFAANVYIPYFDRITSVIRSREISASIILQSLSQLEDMYGAAGAKTILNNCDHCLYLGGADVVTAHYIGSKANKPASSILNMPLDEAWLFERGSAPRQVEKYQPSR